MAVIHFLLVYDLKQQRLVDTQEYRDAREASVAYAALEAAHRGDNDVEIVLVGADSIETVMRTHGQYFSGTVPHNDETDRYLVRLG